MTKQIFQIYIFILLCLYTFSCGLNKSNTSLKYKKDSFPKYEEILNAFFDNGKSPYYPEKTGYYLSFAKKPDGWYVYDSKLGTGESSNFRLFWSFKDKKFLEEAKKGTKLEKETSIIQRYLKQDSNKSFDYNLFYGYPTWTDDVIDALEGKDKLIDEFLFALGNAYSYKAKEILGLYSQNFEIEKKIKPNAKEARKYFQKSIEYFEKLQKQNPEFEAFIGKISIKTAHEYLNAFYMLEVAGFEKEAKSFLKPETYEDFYVNFAKNMLNSCRKNAILFTQGDLDTYALLYVQNQMNYRKDVTIVNLTMLTANWYLNYQLKKLGKLNITKTTYQSKLLDVVLLKQEEGNHDFKTLAEAFNQKNPDFIVTLNNNQQFFQLKSSKIKIGEKMILKNIQPYLYKHKIVLLDIISSFLDKRPIYLASTISSDIKTMFLFNSIQEGLASSITENTERNQENKIDIDLTQKLIDSFAVKSIDSKVKANDNKLRIISIYRHLFSGLTNAYLEDRKQKKALDIAEKSLQLFPDKYVKYDYYTLPLLRTFYENGKTERANEIITKYLEYANQTLKNPTDKEDEISVFQYGTYYLLTILKDFEEGKKRYDEVEQVYKRLEFMVVENDK